MATHSSILAWRIPWTRSLAGYSPWGRQESDATEATSTLNTLTAPSWSQDAELLTEVLLKTQVLSLFSFLL